MTLKKEIKKAITANTKYTAVKVSKPEIFPSGYIHMEREVMIIEVEVVRKKKQIKNI